MDEVVDRLLNCPLDKLAAVISNAVVHASLVHALASSRHDSTSMRQRLAQLVTRLATQTNTLTVPLLAVFCGAFLSTNKRLVRETVAIAFDTDAQLQINVCEHGPELLAQACDAAVTHSTTAWARQTLQSLLALARSHPLVSSSFGQLSRTYSAIAHLYSSLSDPAAPPDTATLELKLDLLSTAWTVLDQASLDPLLDQTNPLTVTDRQDFWSELLDNLGVILQHEQSSNSETTALINATLAQDLQRYYRLADKLDSAARGLDASSNIHTRANAVRQRVRGLDKHTADGEDGLEIVRRLKLGGKAMSNGKGKGKASEDSDSATLDEAVSQIMDVLPDQQATFLRTCLRHPRFADASNPAEAVIAALLEGSLPADLRQPRDGDNNPTAFTDSASSDKPVAPERRNVFDDAKLDLTKLRRGKTALPDTLLDGRESQMNEALKAAIIARAERDSSDEEDEGDLGEAFVDDQDDYGAPTVKLGVRDGHADGGQLDSAGPTPSHTRPSTPASSSVPSKSKPIDSNSSGTSSSPFTPVITSYLEQMYLDNPSLFARDSTTRKSKQREQMRKSSGLSDDRIEEFARMIERNPNKQKVLNKMQNKHEFKGNRVDNGSTTTKQKEHEPSTDSSEASSRTNGNGGSRGGGSRGRGGRGGYSGGKMAHERRVRGNDRKSQKMGAVPQ
ncbi:hypothetical protein ACM66B_003880 [Microbotryomycetes sp. NB124-2]